MTENRFKVTNLQTNEVIVDEAITHAREKEKEQRYYANFEKNNLMRQSCLKCAEEHEQLADWLEELKQYRAHIFSGDLTQKMLKEQYNKSIDDFAEKLNTKCDGMFKAKWNSSVAPISWAAWAEAYADFKDDIDEIAEQLKAGVENV